MTQLKPLYTVPEIAEMIGLSEMTVRKIIRAGELPAIKLGGKWLIKAETLENLKTPKPPKKTKGGGEQ